MADEQVPDGLLWDHPGHIAAKHFIVKRFLHAWFPVAGEPGGEIVFIDGFAGPDQYEGGGPGSPIVALDVAGEHAESLATRDVRFVFITEDYPRAERLQRGLDARDLPANFSIGVHPGTFDQSVTRLLDDLGESEMPPAFVMVDPFGAAGVPFEVMKQLAKQPRCHVLITCIPETIERWGETKEAVGGYVDRIFRGPEWRGLSREEQVALYRDNLQSAGFTHTRALQMSGRRTNAIYYLIAATHDAEGAGVVERALRTAASAEYRFGPVV